MTKPLIVYLDTQDYSNLYDIKSDEMQEIYNYLCDKVDKGDIVIPYSYFIIAELLTAFTDEFRDDRLLRVAIIKRLCGNNTFKFIDPGISLENVISENGQWYPKFDYWEQFKEGIEKEIDKFIESLPKKIAKKIDKKNPWPQLFKISPELAKSISKAASLLPVPKSFSESHLLVKYLKGEVEEKLIKSELEKVFSDLNIFFVLWFENKANTNVKLLHEIIRTVDSSNKCNTPFIFECVIENFIRGSVPESLPGSLV